MKNVLVLGGSYFIGLQVANSLSSNGYHVTILNRGTKPISSQNIHQIVCDRDNDTQLKKVLSHYKFHTVIDISWKNIDWVKSLCDALDFTSISNFVFLSSSAVYDVEHLCTPYSEEDQLAKNQYWTSYGSGKIEAEHYYINYLNQFNTNLMILRPPYVYGENNYAARESFIFRQILNHQPVLIPYSNPKLQFIYTKDLANIILFLLLHNNQKLCIYNVGNRQALTSSEWVNACSKAVGVSASVISVDYHCMGKNVRDFYPFYDYDNILNVNKIHTIYPHEIPFDVGLKSTFNWFINHRGEILFKPHVDRTVSELLQKLT